ncbi:UDP-N-acetylglucosamine 2-epimerase [Phytoactinopolyspora mesophila]|uniref:UDP-N-acetylglucosamine 2-epimerase (Hydrolyzing) n=1 Tax=Phytoactinopolyspora mesophila TaxID=2650750 RepID=A0A7K3M040_9ACTN|nr:UDP-N-acetylglucosamine 2-epimerase [Phytoactinopolyspora mesophila]NDL56656.1 UDP-N-acetylglucosamine 2-epimerase (hydrolyzing) [Phytoactinopolyspora mesophila]
MRRVCVFTGSRADYGPLFTVIQALHDDLEADLRLLVAGGHLVERQGLTVRQVEEDGFRVDERVDMVLSNDTPSAVAKSTGLAMIGFADALARIAPDILVILGDRYEALAVAYAAHISSLPIAHIAGGDLSYGSTDDATRHAITKLSHLHFTANDASRRRVVQMGERPERVHATGLPSIDRVVSMRFLDRTELDRRLNTRLRDPVFVVTYHPATADRQGSRAGVRGLLAALDGFPDASVVFTGTNVDQDGSTVSAAIHEYVEAHRQRSIATPSLGQTVFLSLAKLASLVVGNSSAGLIEAPAVHTPTVNIGSRQDGRPRAASVVDCGESAAEITQAIRHALTVEHQQQSHFVQSPFGDGRAAPRIVSTLKAVDLGSLTPKEFFSIEQSEV